MTKDNTRRPQIKVKSINDWLPYKGQVLIKAVSKENYTTKSGVILGINTHVQYGEGKDSHVADYTETEGDVIALPFIHYTEGYTIPNEISVGDHVWFSYKGSVGATEVISNKDKYILVDYSYLVAARGGGEIKILNGFVLLENVYYPEHPTILQTEKKRNLTRGIVGYIGGKREYPTGSKYSDEIELSVGDEVLIRKGCPDVKFERAAYLATFSDKMYRRIRRRDIVAVINSFELIE